MLQPASALVSESCHACAPLGETAGILLLGHQLHTSILGPFWEHTGKDGTPPLSHDYRVLQMPRRAARLCCRGGPAGTAPHCGAAWLDLRWCGTGKQTRSPAAPWTSLLLSFSRAGLTHSHAVPYTSCRMMEDPGHRLGNHDADLVGQETSPDASVATQHN